MLIEAYLFDYKQFKFALDEARQTDRIIKLYHSI